MKKIAFCIVLLSLLLLISGCQGVGEAVSKTRPVCCCRLTEPYGYELVHFSVCSPPAYSPATELGAEPDVNRDSVKCNYFCSTISELDR